MKPTLPIIAAEWPKGRNEVVRITIDAFEGKVMVGIRTWFEDGGQLRPGRAGINLNAGQHLAKLADGLQRALEVARDGGLIDITRKSAR